MIKRQIISAVAGVVLGSIAPAIVFIRTGNIYNPWAWPLSIILIGIVVDIIWADINRSSK